MYSPRMNDTLQSRLTPLKGQWNRIAELADVSPQTIYRIAWGEQRDHKISTYQRIEAAIDQVSAESVE